MSFVGEADVIELMETTMARVFEATELPVGPPPWPRLSYDEAMARYGPERPDIRFGLEIADLGDGLAGTDHASFANVLGGGGVVCRLNAGARYLSRHGPGLLTDDLGR